MFGLSLRLAVSAADRKIGSRNIKAEVLFKAALISSAQDLTEFGDLDGHPHTPLKGSITKATKAKTTAL